MMLPGFFAAKTSSQLALDRATLGYRPMASAEFRHYKELADLGLDGRHLNVARVHLGKSHALQEEIRAEELTAKIEGEVRDAQRVASMKLQRKILRYGRR
jgi:hypothetical protein